MSGTDIGYAPTHSLRNVRYWPMPPCCTVPITATQLRIHGTEIGHVMFGTGTEPEDALVLRLGFTWGGGTEIGGVTWCGGTEMRGVTWCAGTEIGGHVGWWY
eukprot:3787812-Rhodomonas_salina.1